MGLRSRTVDSHTCNPRFRSHVLWLFLWRGEQTFTHPRQGTNSGPKSSEPPGLFTGTRMTLRQLHHRRAHLSLGNNSWKLLPWNFTHSLGTAPWGASSPHKVLLFLYSWGSHGSLVHFRNFLRLVHLTSRGLVRTLRHLEEQWHHRPALQKKNRGGKVKERGVAHKVSEWKTWKFHSRLVATVTFLYLPWYVLWR